MRVAFLVDGFNLYHSLVRAGQGGRSVKWLDLDGLCRSLLPEIGREARLTCLLFFTAAPNHIEPRSPGAVIRHRDYVAALTARGVRVELGRFKGKLRRCPACGESFTVHEEKETDVAIGVRLLTPLWSGQADAVVLITADGDLTPAIREARRLCPGTPVYCCFPFGRGSHDLRSIATGTFRLRRERYAAHQLPESVLLPTGSFVHRPPTW